MQSKKTLLVIGFVICISIIMISSFANAHSLSETSVATFSRFSVTSSLSPGVDNSEAIAETIQQSQDNFSEQIVPNIIEHYFETGLRTLQLFYLSEPISAPHYSFSRNDIIDSSLGGEVLAEAFSVFWLLATGNSYEPEALQNIEYVLNTFEHLNSSLATDQNNNVVFLPSLKLDAQRYALSIEANLYFVLDSYSIASLLNSYPSLANITVLDKNKLISTGSAVLNTLQGQIGTPLFNNTSGHIMPVWEYNFTDTNFHGSFNSYINKQTSLRLTSLFYMAKLSEWIMGLNIDEDEIVNAFMNYILPNFDLATYYLGNLLVFTDFIHTNSSANYAPTGRSNIMDVGITALFLELFSQLLEKSSNVTRRTELREMILYYAVSLIGGVVNYFGNDVAGFYDSLDINTLTPSADYNVTNIPNGIYSLSSVLVLDFLRARGKEANLEDLSQISIQLGMIISNKLTEYLETRWDENFGAFFAGVVNGGLVPFIEKRVFLNLGVSNVILLSCIVFLNQFNVYLLLPSEVRIDSPLVSRVLLYRSPVTRLFPFNSTTPILGERKIAISSDSLSAYYEITIYSSDLNRTIEAGLVFTSQDFNLTPSAENEGPNVLKIEITNSFDQKIARAETVVFVKGYLLLSGEMKSSDGQTRVIKGVTVSILLGNASVVLALGIDGCFRKR